MENASKALIMAGSIILTVLIVSLVVVMFNNISSLKQTEISSEDEKKLAEYYRQFETFNRNLYGSELLSLANLIDDYNKRQVDSKGYSPITLEFKYYSAAGSSLDGEYNGNNNGYKLLITNFSKIEELVNTEKNKLIVYSLSSNEIKKVEKKQIANSILIATVEKLSDSGNTKYKKDLLRDILERNNKLNKLGSTTDEIEYKLDELTDRMETQCSEYVNLKSEMTEFKNKRFYVENIEYDQNMKITKMVYSQNKSGL